MKSVKSRKNKLGIYARQSREKETSGSIDDQVLKGKLKAKQLGLEFSIYIDRGKSAYSDNFDNRPEFRRLLEDIDKGEISQVFVYDASRLTRNEDTNLQIKKVFKRNGVNVITQVEGDTDFANQQDIFINDIKALFNMKMVTDNAIKIKSVLKNNVAAGRAHAGAIKPFGYTSDSKKMLIIDKDEAEIVLKIYNLALQGYGSGRIAQNLNNEGILTKTQRLVQQGKIGQEETSIFHPSNKESIKTWSGNVVLNILKNPIYKGVRIHKGEEFSAPAIIQQSIWQSVQEQIAKNTNKPGLSKHKYLLKNLCRCGRCGSNLCGRTRPNKRDHIYYCASKVKKIGKCGIRSINIDTLESLIWSLLAGGDYLTNKAIEEAQKLDNVSLIKELEKKLVKIQKQLSQVKAAKDNILSLINSGHITLEEAKNSLEGAKNKQVLFQEEINEINLKLNDKASLKQSIDFFDELFKRLDKNWRTDDFDFKYAVVRMLIKEIIINFDDASSLYSIEITAKIPLYGRHFLETVIDKNGKIFPDKYYSTRAFIDKISPPELTQQPT